jgi:Cupin
MNRQKPMKALRRMTATAAVAAAVAGGLWWSAPSDASTTSQAIAVVATHDHHTQDSNVTFGPAPPVFPAGAEMAVLQGDPSVAGALFTVRLRFPNGYVLPPHWHPTDENVTVISGTFLVGLGDNFDEDALLPPLKRGGFITAPANMSHFATVKGRTVVQVHAIGPFEMTYVHPEDDPRTQP